MSKTNPLSILGIIFRVYAPGSSPDPGGARFAPAGAAQDVVD